MPFDSDRDLVEQWLIYAKSDLELARVDLPSLSIAMIMMQLYNQPIAAFYGQKVLLIADRDDLHKWWR